MKNVNFIFSVDKDMYEHSTISNINGFWTLLIKYIYRSTSTQNLFKNIYETKPELSKEDLEYTELLQAYYKDEDLEVMEINTTKYEAFRHYLNRLVFLKNNPDFKLIVKDYFNNQEYEKNYLKVLEDYGIKEDSKELCIAIMEEIRKAVLDKNQEVKNIYINIYNLCLELRKSINLPDQESLEIFDKLYELVLENYWANNSSSLYVGSILYSDKIQSYLSPIKKISITSLKETQNEDEEYLKEKLKRDNVLQTFNRGFIKSLSKIYPEILLYDTEKGNIITSVIGNKKLENYVTRSSRKVVLPETEFKPLQLNNVSDVYETVYKAYDLLLNGSKKEIKLLCEKLGIKFKENNLEKSVAAIVYGCSKDSLEDSDRSAINGITAMLKKLRKNKISLEEYKSKMNLSDIDITDYIYDTDENIIKQNILNQSQKSVELYSEQQYKNDIKTNFITKKTWIDIERLKSLIENHELRNWTLDEYIEQAKEFIEKHNIKRINKKIFKEIFLLKEANYKNWEPRYFKKGSAEELVQALEKPDFKNFLNIMLSKILYIPESKGVNITRVKDIVDLNVQRTKIYKAIKNLNIDYPEHKNIILSQGEVIALIRKLNLENVNYLRQVFSLQNKENMKFEDYTKELYTKIKATPIGDLAKHKIICAARIYANLSREDFISNAGINIEISTFNKWQEEDSPDKDFEKLYEYSLDLLYSVNEYIAQNVFKCSKTAVCDSEVGENVFGNPINHYLWIRSAIIRRASKMCNKLSFCKLIKNIRYQHYEMGLRMPANFVEFCNIEEALNGKLPKTKFNRTSPYGYTRMIKYTAERNTTSNVYEEPTNMNKDTYDSIRECYGVKEEPITEIENNEVIKEEPTNDVKDIEDIKNIEDLVEEIKEENNSSDVLWLNINISRENGKEEYSIKRKIRIENLKNYLSTDLLDSIIL